MSQVLIPDTLRDHRVNGGRVERDGNRFRLVLPPIGADAYADAQVDDYDHGTPRRFPNRPPQRLAIRARFSHQALKGTAGFGFWNHPFSRAGGVIEPPCNVWFFYSSPESDLRVARGLPGHGFKAAMLNSSPPGMMGGITRLPGVLRAASALLRLPGISRLILSAARTAVRAHETMLDVDSTLWHDYRLDWLEHEAHLAVDGRSVLRAPAPPGGPLGFVAWVDNYRATATGDAAPRGRNYEFAYVDVREEQWLEMIIA